LSSHFDASELFSPAYYYSGTRHHQQPAHKSRADYTPITLHQTKRKNLRACADCHTSLQYKNTRVNHSVTHSQGYCNLCTHAPEKAQVHANFSFVSPTIRHQLPFTRTWLPTTSLVPTHQAHYKPLNRQLVRTAEVPFTKCAPGATSLTAGLPFLAVTSKSLTTTPSSSTIKPASGVETVPIKEPNKSKGATRRTPSWETAVVAASSLATMALTTGFSTAIAVTATPKS
jgi:hypothetical protein